MTAITFSLTRLLTVGPAGVALVCVDARYASISVRGVQPLIRRYATSAQWKAITEQVVGGIEPGPLPVLSAVLGGEDARSFAIPYVTVADVAVDPLNVTEVLDARLRLVTSAVA